MKHLRLLSVAIFSVGFLAFAPSALASILYLSPGSGSISPGATKSVQVRFSGQGDTVNAVSAYLSYPQDKLEYVSTSYGGSTFSIAAEGSGGGGVVRISRASLSGVSGDVNVATVNFRGIASGTANVSFIGGSAAPRSSDSTDSLKLGSSPGATFTIGGAASAPAASKSTQPTPKPNPLLIQDIEILEVATNSAKIAWKTSQKAASSLSYGLEKNQYIITLPEDKASLEHSVVVSGPLLTPGATYHFRLMAEDAAGSEWSSDNQTFHLPGYNLTIILSDENNRPLSSAQTEIFGYSQKLLTDQAGQATFEDMLSGRNLLIVRFNGQERTHEFTIADSPLAQTINIKVAGFRQGAAEEKTLTPSNRIIFGLIVALIIILILTITIWKKRKIQTFTPPSSLV